MSNTLKIIYRIRNRLQMQWAVENKCMVLYRMNPKNNMPYEKRQVAKGDYLDYKWAEEQPDWVRMYITNKFSWEVGEDPLAHKYEIFLNIAKTSKKEDSIKTILNKMPKDTRLKESQYLAAQRAYYGETPTLPADIFPEEETKDIYGIIDQIIDNGPPKNQL